MMNRKEFYEYVKDNVKAYLPKSYEEGEIKLQEVEKNNGLKPVSYTHLDVYKRQVQCCLR